MAANQPPWPREWLMTDERIGHGLWQSIDALPHGRAGIVFRYHSLETIERAELAERVSAICVERQLTLAVSRDVSLACAAGAGIVHNPEGDPCGLAVSRSVHSFKEAEAAWCSGADLIFLSPIFATRTHPGQAPMTEHERDKVLAASPVPVIALGGMNRTRFREVGKLGFYGWAGIDAWLGGQA